MSIQTETYIINNRSFTRTYSDANRYVMRDGIAYSEANAPTEYNRTYTEGDLIEDEDENTENVEELI